MCKQDKSYYFKMQINCHVLCFWVILPPFEYQGGCTASWSENECVLLRCSHSAQESLLPIVTSISLLLHTIFYSLWLHATRPSNTNIFFFFFLFKTLIWTGKVIETALIYNHFEWQKKLQIKWDKTQMTIQKNQWKHHFTLNLNGFPWVQSVKKAHS